MLDDNEDVLPGLELHPDQPVAVAVAQNVVDEGSVLEFRRLVRKQAGDRWQRGKSAARSGASSTVRKQESWMFRGDVRSAPRLAAMAPRFVAREYSALMAARVPALRLGKGAQSALRSAASCLPEH